MDEVPLESVGKPAPLWQPAFLQPLDLEYLDGRNWRVLTAFNYESAVLGRMLTIPAGFVTDFASSPRYLWWLLPPTGPYGKPACLHDMLYRRHGLATKAQADLVFLEAMTALNVGRVTRLAMYHAVVLFGSSSYQGGL